MGRFTVTIPHIVNFATATGSGEYQFTAANGDTLSADFTGSATPTENGFYIVETGPSRAVPASGRSHPGVSLANACLTPPR